MRLSPYMRGNFAPNFPSQEKEVFSLPYFIDKELRLAVKELLRAAEINADLLLPPSAPPKPCCSLPSSQSGSFKNQGRSLHISAQNPSLTSHLSQNKMWPYVIWLPLTLLISPLQLHWPPRCSSNIPCDHPKHGHLRALLFLLPWACFPRYLRTFSFMPFRCCSIIIISGWLFCADHIKEDSVIL